MSFKIDLTGIEAWEAGDILPPGTYLVEVDDAQEGKSSNQNPQLELELRATEGDCKGGTIRDWIVVNTATAGKVKQILAAFGVGDLDGEVSFDAADLIGKRARIVVRTEVYDGKDRTRVKGYEAAGEPVTAGAGKKADDDDLPF